MRTILLLAPILLFLSTAARSQDLVGEGPRLGPVEDRITQADIEDGDLSLKDLRKAGLKIFATPFNQHDGMGDARPTLQGNGAMLRVNGLDSQTCLECHGVLSTLTVPVTFGVGGSGTQATIAMFMPTEIDVDDSDGNGFAGFNGRAIVPPHIFGAGGVQLVAKEMTQDLQDLAQLAIDNPDTEVELDTKGVNFGTISADPDGNLDLTDVEGVTDDLVVKPFGRKGSFATVRGFDLGAMQFHHGMQPVEVVGENVDEDGDGVENEILVGEISALSIFLTTMEAPEQERLRGAAQRGADLFDEVGCADCHRPVLETTSKVLPHSFPEVDTDPYENVFHEVDLSKRPSKLKKNDDGGVSVRLFSDLKRHDMGDAMSEDFHGADADENATFITAKLWGVADTAPYMHDGRAMTLQAAILMHGGAGTDARDAYSDLEDEEKEEVLAFLGTLRTPKQPNKDVFKRAPRRPKK